MYRLYHQCPAWHARGSVKIWMGVAKVAGRLLEGAQFGVIEETSPNHSLAEAKRAMKRSNPMKLVWRVGAAHPLTHPTVVDSFRRC